MSKEAARRCLFREFADGKSAIAIARDPDASGIAGPAGCAWRRPGHRMACDDRGSLIAPCEVELG